MIVDLGCGGTKRGDIGIDIVGPPVTAADIVCNLGFEDIPMQDNSVDKAVAHHFVEHIPDVVYKYNHEPVQIPNYRTRTRRQEPEGWIPHRPIIFLFNEVYRILKNRGIFYVQVPAVMSPGNQVHVQAFQDPQHVSFWTADRLNYFSGDYFGHHDTYGHTSRFQLTKLNFGCGHGWTWCMEFEMMAIKDVPESTPYQLNY